MARAFQQRRQADGAPDFAYYRRRARRLRNLARRRAWRLLRARLRGMGRWLAGRGDGAPVWPGVPERRLRAG